MRKWVLIILVSLLVLGILAGVFLGHGGGGGSGGTVGAGRNGSHPEETSRAGRAVQG
jgi:preprotein translocase subunit SecG